MDTKAVCLNCHRAFRFGDWVEVEKCADCPMYDGPAIIEEPYLIPEEDVYYGVDIAGEREYRISQDHAEALEMERQERELDEFTPSQQSGEREPVRQRVNGWPGRKARKVRNG